MSFILRFNKRLQGGLFILSVLILWPSVALAAEKEMVWGFRMGFLAFLCAGAIGCCLLAAMSRVYGLKGLAPFFKRAVFLSMLCSCAGAIVLLTFVEEPWRLIIYNAVSPNLTSNFWWMTTLVGIMSGCMFIEFAGMLQGTGETKFVFGFVGAVAGMGANNNLAAMLAKNMDPPLWYGPQPLILFLASTLLSGVALISIAAWAGQRLCHCKTDKKTAEAFEIATTIAEFMLCVLLAIYLFRFFTAFSADQDSGRQAVDYLLTGKLQIRFWLLEIGFGMLFPLVILLTNRQKDERRVVIAAALSLF